jgi:hypothetical protein
MLLMLTFKQSKITFDFFTQIHYEFIFKQYFWSDFIISNYICNKIKVSFSQNTETGAF